MICYVYIITCKENNKSYIGISNNPLRRFKEHFRRAYKENGKQYNSSFYRCVRKYGINSFECKVLLAGNRKYCLNAEIKLIDAMDTYYNGLNDSKGGEGSSEYISWNKGTVGICKPNKTSFQKGNIPPTTILTSGQINQLITEYKNGISVHDMSWLPVSTCQAFRVLTREKVKVTKNNWYYLSLKMLELYENGITRTEIAEIFNKSYKIVCDYILKSRALLNEQCQQKAECEFIRDIRE